MSSQAGLLATEDQNGGATALSAPKVDNTEGSEQRIIGPIQAWKNSHRTT